MTDLLNSIKRPAMISLCDVTGVMAEPWAEAGYDCYCVDVQHSIRRDRTVEFGGGGSISSGAMRGHGCRPKASTSDSLRRSHHALTLPAAAPGTGRKRASTC